MKATVNAASLKSAVSWVSKVVKACATLPVLEYLMLSANDGTLEVKATDLSIALMRQVKADVSEPGQVLIRAKDLKDCLRGMKDAAIAITSTPALNIFIRTEKTSMTFYGLDPDDYPLVPQDVGWDNAISVDPAESMLPEIAKFAAPEKEGRLVLTCVLVEVYDDGYRLTAADGFRLVSTTNAISGELVATYLLPASVVKPIAALKTSGVLLFNAEKMLAEFTTDTSRVQCMLVEGHFPDYNQIIPASDRGTWVVFDT